MTIAILSFELYLSVISGTAGLIGGIICFGGYTRLTESGLSMTDWKFRGRSYPRTPEEWEIEFSKYKVT